MPESSQARSDTQQTESKAAPTAHGGKREEAEQPNVPAPRSFFPSSRAASARTNSLSAVSVKQDI